MEMTTKTGRVIHVTPMADAPGRYEVRNERGELVWMDTLYAIRLIWGVK